MHCAQTVAQHLFGIENNVVVHHTHCGATSFTADGIIDAFKREQGVDISDLYERDSICISDYVKSLQHDTRLLREAKGTPRHVNVYGYLYDIDTDELRGGRRRARSTPSATRKSARRLEGEVSDHPFAPATLSPVLTRYRTS